MRKSHSSHRWLKRQKNDIYVKKAQEGGYRSRAAYKLEELDRRYHLFRPGQTVVDLGAAPGGWSQYLAQRVRPDGRIVALDILPMEPLPGVDFIQGDFQRENEVKHLRELLGNQGADAVVSDMAPNFSGIVTVDQPRSIYLAELALQLTLDILKSEGFFLVKLLQGEGFDQFVRQSRRCLRKVTITKPRASRSQSREVYLLGRRRTQNLMNSEWSELH